ncbi:unnamed protein product [Lepidochelys kempii]
MEKAISGEVATAESDGWTVTGEDQEKAFAKAISGEAAAAESDGWTVTGEDQEKAF